MEFTSAVRRAVVAVPAAPHAGGSLAAFVPVAPGGNRAPAPLRWGAAASTTGKQQALLVALCGPAPDGFNNSVPFYRFMEDVDLNAFELLSDLTPPAHLADKTKNLKAKLAAAAKMARAGDPDKLACAIELVRCAHAIVELTYECFPNLGLTPPPEEPRFVSMCLAVEATPLLAFNLSPEVDEADAKLMRSVMFAMNFATCAATARTARCAYGCRDAGIVT